MNLVLCGMPGAGKSAVGAEIAARKGLRFADTDALIEARCGAIKEIFARHGEGYFRDLETETVRTLAACDGLVISTGGGLMMRPENRALLSVCTVVYLRAKVKTLAERMRGDATRPLLAGDMTARLQALIEERGSVYESAADFVVDTDGRSVEEIAEIIFKEVHL